MAIDKKEVQKLATLSRLKFTDEELDVFTKEFEATLEQVKLIDKVDVSNIDLKNSSDKILATELREDIPQVGFTQSDVIMNAPSQKDGEIVVPITVEEGGN